MSEPIAAEPGSPTWALRLIQRLEQRFRSVERPTQPVFVPEVVDATQLPKASDWRSAVVFVKSIDRLAVSNGTNWLRVDNGASL